MAFVALGDLVAGQIRQTRAIMDRQSDRSQDLLEDVIREALADAQVGQTLVICRDVTKCRPQELCDCCAQITVYRGITVDDILEMVRPNRA